MNDPNICKKCNGAVAVECGYAPTSHGMCDPCASAMLDRLLTRDATTHHELVRNGLATVVRKHHDGVWIHAGPLNCVKTPLARAYVTDLLHAIEQAEAME